MLHQSAVSLSLLKALGDLQDKIAGTGFALAGGTSLALRLGHRVSFTTCDFEPAKLADRLGAGHETITGLADAPCNSS